MNPKVAEAKQIIPEESHSSEALLRSSRMPHIWCPGCGLGIALKAYVRAMEELKDEIPLQKQVCVSGIGCSGRIAGYVNIDSYHTTHGRAIPFAIGLKLANPELSVTVFSGDGDLLTIGGNHFIQAIRRNFDINVFLVNNFIYGMTGGQFGASTPMGVISSTTPYGNWEDGMNVPALAEALGAPHVSRWTTLHVRQLASSMKRAFRKSGFSLLEIISPCPPGFGRKNHFPTGNDMMEYFHEQSVLDPKVDLRDAGLPVRPGEPILVGDFIDHDRPSYLERMSEFLQKAGFAPESQSTS